MIVGRGTSRPVHGLREDLRIPGVDRGRGACELPFARPRSAGPRFGILGQFVPPAAAAGLLGACVDASGKTPGATRVAAATTARANPCAAENACAAKTDPCAAEGANPCNPCAGAAVKRSDRCFVPELRSAALANPCAAKNPGAAKANPCAAEAASPCAANPCGAAPAVQLTPVQARRAYACLLPEMLAAYAKAGDPTAKAYAKWPRFSAQSYQSATHGQRYVQNYADPKSTQRYGRFEKAGRFPAGAVIAKDSFVAHPDGSLEVGPLFIMEKVTAGSSPTGFDWTYRMVNPDGSVAGDANVQSFCAGYHGLLADSQDSLYFVPPDFRRRP